MIVVHGPQASGKTFHSERIAAHYGCTRIIEIDERGRHAARPGDLVLSYESTSKLRRWFPCADIVSIRDARVAIGEAAEWKREPAPVSPARAEPITLPVKVGRDGEVVDARGELLLIVDVNRDLPDARVAAIQRAVADALNQRLCAPTGSDRIEALAAKLAARDGLVWSGVCGYEAGKDDCDSGTCVAAHFEDHDPSWARQHYRGMAQTAFDDLVNTPETAGFLAGVPLEAAHQRERWGSEHDEGKSPFDWFWLIGYLAQKAAAASVAGDTDKALHHTISTAAALANWHAALSGASTAMRPGIDPADMKVAG
ncbi:hypothetical protein [Sphingomonas beigongshangi]|uniref:hypothetical protein n=1 Tax=Sphingomonas beigongshangi TaxID=2782540 RepID=UPI001AEE2BB7|nr:hypothetical protein [Sphingomonas beigongshangi]